MAEALVKLDIPADAVRALVAAEVGRSIGDPQQFFAVMVRELLSEKVRDPNTYRDRPRIEAMVLEEVKKLAVEFLREAIEQSKPQIKRNIAKAIRGTGFVNALTDALLQAVSSGSISHSLRVELSLGGRS